MSRVEDDREAARLAERLMLQKRQEEGRARQKDGQESAFAKLLQKGQGEQSQTQARKDAAQKGANRMYEEAMAHAADEVELYAREQGRDSNTMSQAKQAGQAFGDKLRKSQAAEGQLASEAFQGEQANEEMVAAGRAGDRHSAESTAESRRSDARASNERLEERGEAARQGGAAGGAAHDGGELRADGDGGGQKGSGGDKKEGGGEMGAGQGFRLNPALMAPVPVAKPKDTGASARLRALANEIAQKIVERVRVGTNATGMAEFQIDLRSNVLAGLSIKVSGGNGRIKAAFSGSDREVLKLLEQQKDGLKSALASRGLTLEDLRVDYRA